ncbi:LOW QUALITY PROTEIN: olfactory receptor 51A4-like [Morus bassanus]
MDAVERHGGQPGDGTRHSPVSRQPEEMTDRGRASVHSEHIPGNSSHALAFLLTGIPGMACFHRWVFFPRLMHLIAMLGNGTILLIVRANRRLHQPMYYFLSMLATTDLGLTLSTFPMVLHVWFSTGEISFLVCFTQMFCTRAFSFTESSALAMAFDHYMAICCIYVLPLRYSSILTTARVAKIGLGMVCCSLMLLLLCKSLHQDMILLACTDSTLKSLCGLTLVLFTLLDLVLITLSYSMIIKTVEGITSREEQTKALDTCISHFCTVLIFYVPRVGLSIIHWYRKNAAPFNHMLMPNVYPFVPPVLNPIIYSMKNKPFRKGILRLLCQRLACPGHGQQPWSH